LASQRWAMPIADIFNPAGVFGYILTPGTLKGFNMSAQGNTLRHQDRIK